MAQRRMFSKTVTNSGKFLKMPATSRLLYYDLGMNADDDGFAEWFTVIRMTGATEQDMGVLQANGFVKIFDENVLVILDWKENNYLRSDRYTPSKYLAIYGNHGRLESGIPTVDTGKDRIGKDKSVAVAPPILEVSIPSEEGGRRESKSKDGFQADYEDLLKWAEARRGFKFVSRTKQYAALKKARLAGKGPAKLQGRWKELEDNSFYDEIGFDWATVVSSFDKKS